jgi:hypothetical protein
MNTSNNSTKIWKICLKLDDVKPSGNTRGVRQTIMVFNRPQEWRPTERIETGLDFSPILAMGEVPSNRRLKIRGCTILWVGWVNECFDVNHPQSGVVM